LTGRAHRAHRRQTATDQIAHCFVRRVGHPDRGQQSTPVQHGQVGGVALVVLLSLATLRGIIDGATTMQPSPNLARLSCPFSGLRMQNSIRLSLFRLMNEMQACTVEGGH
jgi:hypothetical protein